MAPVFVEVGLGGLRRVDVEIFLVDAEDGQSEGDRAVVPDRDAGQGRFAGADQVEFRRAEVDNVAERGHCLGAVRIVRKQRPAGGGTARRDRPVVAALGCRKGLILEPRLEVVETNAAGAQPVDVERLRWCSLRAEEVEVQAVGHGEPVLRLVAVAERKGVHAVVREEPGPPELADRVPQQTMAADACHRLRGPVRRLVAQRLELRRHQLGALEDQVDPGVHAAGPGSDDALRVRSVGEPLGVHVAAVQQQPGGPVLLDETGPEDLRQRSLAPSPPEVDLPQAVAGRVPALGEEEVVLTAGEDVGHSPAIDQNLDRLLESGHLVAGHPDGLGCRDFLGGGSRGNEQGDRGGRLAELSHRRRGTIPTGSSAKLSARA